jgi:hypothetical protein
VNDDVYTHIKNTTRAPKGCDNVIDALYPKYYSDCNLQYDAQEEEDCQPWIRNMLQKKIMKLEAIADFQN